MRIGFSEVCSHGYNIEYVDNVIVVQICCGIPAWISRDSSKGYCNCDYIEDVDFSVCVHITED